MTDDSNDRYLFSSRDLGDLLQARKVSAVATASEIDPNDILLKPTDHIVDELFEAHRIPRTHLDRAGITGDVNEIRIDVSNDFNRHITDRSQPFYIPGTRISLRIPFNGPRVFGLRARRHSLSPPIARLEANTLVVSCSIPSDQLQDRQEAAIQDLHRQVDRIEESLTWIQQDLDSWEPDLRNAIRSAVRERQEHVRAMRSTETLLGVPIERDSVVAETYAVDLPKRRPVPRPLPSRTHDAVEPEPAITDEDFAEIIGDIKTVLSNFERLPLMPSEASEERLRDQIVMILNSIYGEASAESFSKRGKTDIYLPWENNAVFLAECKWWVGQQKFRNEALPQLLDRYIVWRDTHTAMILFIRNKDVSAIVAKAVKSIQQHPRYVRDADSIEDVRTFILHQDGDEHRRFRLALLTAAIIP